MQRKLRYSNFWNSINVDAFEEAIEWSPEYTDNDNDIGFCVFPENHSHGDTTGKFAIHREKRVYNCWACGGGSLLSLTMELLDMDIEEATEWLFQFAEKDTRSDTEFVDEFINSFHVSEVKNTKVLPYFNERVLEKFDDSVPDSWLESRGISKDTIDRYGVRYSDNAFRPVPLKDKYKDQEPYEGPAIIFPHYHQDKLVGWQSRWLDDERPVWIPKYTMTGDFPKEETLYGWDQLVTFGNPVFVVESVPSVLFLDSLGLSAVATFGSNVNEQQMKILRSASTIILAPDNDEAGRKWTRELYSYLKRYTDVLLFPLVSGQGSDIGDLADEPEIVIELLKDGLEEMGIDL